MIYEHAPGALKKKVFHTPDGLHQVGQVLRDEVFQQPVVGEFG